MHPREFQKVELAAQLYRMDELIRSIKHLFHPSKGKFKWEPDAFLDLLQVIVEEPILRNAIAECKSKEEVGAFLKSAIYQKRLNYWKEYFGEKALGIMELINWTCDYQFDLSLPITKLKETAKKAIFWREIKGVKIFPVKEAVRLNEFIAKLNGYEEFLFSRKYFKTLQLENKKDITLRRCVNRKLCRFHFYGRDIGISFRIRGMGAEDHVLSALRETCYYAIAFHLIDIEKDFLPLFTLWKVGNFPVGFDKDNNLLVLCAES